MGFRSLRRSPGWPRPWWVPAAASRHRLVDRQAASPRLSTAILSTSPATYRPVSRTATRSQRSRCTSPAPRARARVGVHQQRAGVIDPPAVPEPPSQRTSAPEGVARAPGRQHLARFALEPRAERGHQRVQDRLHRRGLARRGQRERGRRVRQLGRELRRGHVQADAQHGPAVLRATLHEDARQLAAVDPDVVRPLDRGSAPARAPPRPRRPPRRPRAAAPRGAPRGRATTSDINTADPGGAVHERPWRPRPALCSAAVTSVPCGAPAPASALARALVESISRA